MSGLYEWIRNITYYLIFMTVVSSLLPNRKYEKYLKLFAGMVLILLVLKPLTGGLKLDDRLAYYFEAITFQKEAGQFSEEMTEMEEKRLSGMITQYEEAVGTDLKTMAEADGLACAEVFVSIDGNQDSENFGHVVSVKMVLEQDEEENGEGAVTDIEQSTGEELQWGGVAQVDAVEQITPVQVDRAVSDGSGETGNQETPMDLGKAGDAAVREGQEKTNGISGLRKRIAEYYDLEEQDIEIQLENGKG